MCLRSFYTGCTPQPSHERSGETGRSVRGYRVAFHARSRVCVRVCERERTAAPMKLSATASSGMTACPSEEIEGDSCGASDENPLTTPTPPPPAVPSSTFSAYLGKNTIGFCTLENSEGASEGSRCAAGQRAGGCSDVVRLNTPPITQEQARAM